VPTQERADMRLEAWAVGAEKATFEDAFGVSLSVDAPGGGDNPAVTPAAEGAR